ncbi:MAG: serine kinase [Paracoccus sp. (in: a-proteobacteria)]|uniref:HPr kinase/phosphorylase n=1 Tax=Paracoccus sp. TaxID=267 RepID=UPI0026DF14BA|nr:serine kinase [Paracoccus sp. (in: a-proteobacteria)]MDO5620672.1 serine kinase [Paracoccus sp. (in: a-proteobacteria)]
MAQNGGMVLVDGGVIHASAVVLAGQGVLILGPSGAGKSTLALALMAIGAALVADDRVRLRTAPDGVWLEAPPSLPPLIEARGVGLLRAVLAGPVRLALVVDLARAEPDRLPPARHINVLMRDFPLVLGADHPHLAPALRQFLLHGRIDPDPRQSEPDP